jgi:fructose-bisphosphate aldolase, class II
MRTLLDALKDADRRHVAIGHFNVSELVALKAATGVARELGVPVIIGVSEGERAFIGTREIAALIGTIQEDSGGEIYLNADHVHTLASAEEAARAGFDLLVFDASESPFAENIAATRAAVEAVKAIRSAILVEGEIGYIGAGSQIHEEAAAAARPPMLTTPDEARHFLAATGVDLLAPAVGSAHGMTRRMLGGEAKQHLDIHRIAEIKQATGALLTLHGGSGTDDEDFRRAIKAGITVVHISTELRVAFRRGVEAALAAHPDEVVPYKLFSEASQAVAEVVRQRLHLFNNP